MQLLQRGRLKIRILSADSAAEYPAIHVLMDPKKLPLHRHLSYPNIKFDILVCDCLHVESHGGDGVDRLSQLQLVQDGRLSGRVQPQHQDPHLLVAEHLRQDLPHLEQQRLEQQDQQSVSHDHYSSFSPNPKGGGFFWVASFGARG